MGPSRSMCGMCFSVLFMYTAIDATGVFSGHPVVGSSHRVRSLVISTNVADAYCLQTSKKQYAFHIYSWNNLDGLPQGGEENWEEVYPTENLNIEAYGIAYVSLPLSESTDKLMAT